MRRLFTLILVFVATFSLYAQTDENQELSLIIALDVRSNIGRYLKHDIYSSKSYYYDNYDRKSYKEYYSTKIIEVLGRHDIAPNYVSGVLYGKESGVKTPTNFSKMVINPTKNESDYTDILSQLYKKLPSGEYYSITSFARPYSLKALKDQQSTNRTFLIIFTDGRYNGNDDYYGEAEYMQMDFSNDGKKQFMKDILDVQTNYFCQFIEQVEVDGGHIQLYEFIPLQQYFALESVLDFPHEIQAQRGKSKYVLNFNSKAISNDDYEIKKMRISLVSDGQSVRTEEFSPNEIIEFEMNKKDISKSHLEIKAWVKLCDGIYNNTILHPYGSKLQGASGLTREIKIEKESNAKILGIMELPDFLYSLSFWTASQATAAATWGWIFILIIVSIVIAIIYKSNIYKVKEGTTKI